MTTWLRTLLGLDEGEVPAGSEAHWEFSSLPRDAWLAAAAAIVLAAVVLIALLYIKERGLRGWQRGVLSAVRLLALALVVLILLNPRVLTEIHLEHPGRTLLLLDVSGSMFHEDELEPADAEAVERATDLSMRERPSRAEIAVAALEKHDVIARLERKNRVQAFTFGDKLKAVSPAELRSALRSPAGSTRLGDALREALASAGREPLAGIVVVSDGRSNAGEPPLAALRELAFERRAPVHALGIGRDQLPRNYAVKDIVAPQVVSVGDPVEIEAEVAVSGIRGPVLVALYRAMKGARGRELIESRRLDVAGESLESRLKFVDRLERKGVYRYTVSFPRDATEVEWRDNDRSTQLTAAEETRRVLLVAGHATPEYRFVRNLGERDDGVQVSCWLSSADPGYPQGGDVPISELPATPDALRAFDVVLLFDPEPETMSQEFQRGLVEFVSEQGGGLGFVAGEMHTQVLAADPAFRYLRSLLPVDLASADRPPRGLYSEPWRPELLPRGRMHPILRLRDSEEESTALWQRVPGFFFVFPAAKLRVGGVALLGHERYPVAAVQRVGLAEVVYLGTDFRSLRAAGPGVHERFWGGIVRYLAAGKHRSGGGKATVETDRDRYREGEDVRLVAHLVDGQRRPVDLPRVDATVEWSAPGERPEHGPGAVAVSARGGGEVSGSASIEKSLWSVALAPVPGAAGTYSGVFRAAVAGQFEARLEGQEEARAFFRVESPSTEWDEPSPDFELLREIAAESGGRFYTLRDLDDLPGAIPETTVKEVLGRRAATVWDSAAMMCLFTGLLVIEWVLRKLWRLN